LFNPKHNLLEEQLAASGLELSFFGLFGGGGGGNDGSKFAKKQGQKSYEFNKKKYAADNEALDAKYKYQLESYNIQKDNLKDQAKLKDKLSIDQYNKQLKINFLKDKANAKAFNKSELLYAKGVSLAKQAASSSQDAALAQLKETFMAAAFEQENSYIDSMKAQGQVAVINTSGRTRAKAMQSELAELGRDEAVLAASLGSAEKQFSRDLSQLTDQLDQALLQASANRMLKPTKSPLPIAPYKSLIPKIQEPQEVEDFHYGPKPIKYGTYVPSSQGPTFGSAATGVLSGAATGAGLGASIAAAGMAGSAAGPIGAVVGAGIGLIGSLFS
jgi:hypothetical protein